LRWEGREEAGRGGGRGFWFELGFGLGRAGGEGRVGVLFLGWFGVFWFLG